MIDVPENPDAMPTTPTESTAAETPQAGKAPNTRDAARQAAYALAAQMNAKAEAEADAVAEAADGTEAAAPAAADPHAPQADTRAESVDDVSQGEPKRPLREQLRERDRARAEVDSLKRERAEFERMRADFDAQRQQFQLYMQNLSRQQEALSKLKTDPMSALTDLGVDYNELTRAAVEHNTPVAAATRELQALKAELQKYRDETSQIAQWRQQQEVERTHRDFLAKVTPETAPIAARVFKGKEQELIEEAYAAQERIRRRNGTRDVSQAQILEELENRLESVYGIKSAQSGAPAPAGTVKQATRPLGAPNGIHGERKPVDLKALTPEQRAQYAKKQAASMFREADRASREAKKAP